MIPKKFTLRGALGIQAGLGRNELTIDLDSVVPDDVLTVALKADNGSGKSTILNLALTPWLNPPQIPGSMYDQFGPEGERILEWSHGTESYRSTIQYHQTEKTQTTKATLHVRKEKTWHPVVLPDHTTSDGKTRTYSTCLEHILGPQSIYYLSAFRAQNAPHLADYDDPEALMTDLLSLDEPRDLATKASAVRLQLDRALDGIKTAAEELTTKRERLIETSFDIDKLCDDTAAAEDNKRVAMEACAKAKAEYDHAVAESADHARMLEARRKIEEQISARNDRHKDEQQKLNDSAAANATRRGQIEKDAKTAAGDIEADISTAKKSIAQREAIVQRSDEIHKAVSALINMEKEGQGLEQEIEKLQEKVESKRQAALELTGISHTLSNVLRDGLSLKGRMDDLNARAAYVEQVPCEGKAPYDTCPALQDAIQAATTALTVEAERETKLAEYGAVKADIDTRQQILDAMGDPEADLASANEGLAELRRRISAARPTAANLPLLESAKTDIDNFSAQIVNLEERLKGAVDTKASRLFACTSELAVINHRLEGAKTTADQDIGALQAELDALPAPGESDALDKARDALRIREQSVVDAATALEDNTANIAHLKAERTGLEREIKAGADISARFSQLTDERALWYQLADGLRGVVKLSIEDAGPGIADIANRLLREADGPRFTLRIITQRQNKTNNKIKEVFDISVIDSDAGLESSIVHKSGGENVLLDRCLTEAVGLYHQDAAGIHYETLFADEVDGALSEEKRINFYRMERAALELGGYKRKFFVSHAETAWSFADHVIDLAEYQKK